MKLMKLAHTTTSVLVFFSAAYNIIWTAATFMYPRSSGLCSYDSLRFLRTNVFDCLSVGNGNSCVHSWAASEAWAGLLMIQRSCVAAGEACCRWDLLEWSSFESFLNRNLYLSLLTRECRRRCFWSCTWSIPEFRSFVLQLSSSLEVGET